MADAHPDYPDDTAHLRAVGYWRPMDRRRKSSRPDPRALVDTTRTPQERTALAAHLRAGTVLLRWLGSSTCRFCGLRPNGNTCLTDGVNVWPEGLAHYVEAHDVWVDLALTGHTLCWPDGGGERYNDAGSLPTRGHRKAGCPVDAEPSESPDDR